MLEDFPEYIQNVYRKGSVFLWFSTLNPIPIRTNALDNLTSFNMIEYTHSKSKHLLSYWVLYIWKSGDC